MCSGISHDVVLRVDAARHIMAVNPECSRVIAGPGRSLLGCSLLELVHPDDRGHVTGRLAEPQAPGLELMARLRGADSLYHKFALRWTEAGPAGELLLSGREQPADPAHLAMKLGAISECVQECILITNADLTIIYISNEPEEAKQAGGALGKPMLAFAAPEEVEPMRRRVAHVMSTGELVVYETVGWFADGSIRNFRSRLAAVRDGDRVVGVVLIARDITAERQLEEAKRSAEQMLREYMVQLERSNGELERFASIASHDLQEPLRKIQAFSDRLRDRFVAELPDTGRDYLERIRSAAKRMQDLINDLLLFSRLSAKEQTYSRVNLTKIAKSVLSDLEVRIEETAGTIHLGELPIVDADPVHMRQLLQNLIGNALKFTRPDTPPVVHITGEVMPAVAGEGPTLRLIVADNGIGIEPRHHDRIFGIFERLHGRGKYEGTGVGLAVCRKIVEQHHGTISVASVVDQGTTFTILLPMKQPERTQKQ